MKKAMCMFLAVLMILGLAGCGQEKQDTETEGAAEGFRPALDLWNWCLQRSTTTTT